MNNPSSLIKELEWEKLIEFSSIAINRTEGPTNPYSKKRLFGKDEKDIRVTLYRDHHAWCPYCQKIWLWLEWKRIPYSVKKVTMRCYGKKEDWYLKKVPSGILPAIEIDNNLYTESDQIIFELEKIFGPLGQGIIDPRIIELRQLERNLFRAWCIWLCQPSLFKSQEMIRQKEFQELAKKMELVIKNNSNRFLDTNNISKDLNMPGTIDIIFIPYLERMNASLAYYKGFNLRKEHPYINIWLEELEKSSVYRGTQGDMHTHAHDLPPQMGGCFYSKNKQQIAFSKAIDLGDGLQEMETSFTDDDLPKDYKSEAIALERVIKHKDKIKDINIIDSEYFDQPLRAALTLLISNQLCKPNKGSAKGLRYLRDRISVPRDMPLLSARKLRKALEITASLDSEELGPKISMHNRFDQDPKPFLS